MLAVSLALVDPSDSELQKELAAWEASPNGQYAARLGLVPKSSQESIMSEDAALNEKLKRWKAKKAMLPIYAQRNPYAKFTMNTCHQGRGQVHFWRCAPTEFDCQRYYGSTSANWQGELPSTSR
ncbi:unnamed protein product [Aphanomyces euteiches]